MDAITYAYEANGDVRLTGARYSGTADEIIRGFVWNVRYASLDAVDISLAHAFFEADAMCDWTHFAAHLTPELRARAVRMGALD